MFWIFANIFNESRTSQTSTGFTVTRESIPRRRYKTPQTLGHSFAIEKGEKKVRDIDPSHEMSRTTRSISIIYLQ